MAKAKAKATPKSSLIERTQREALARNTARLSALLTLVRRRMTAVVEGFYDVGEALREILDKKLYAASGHASFEALLKAEELMSKRQAMKLVALVRKVPREQALSLGQEKAYALVSYTAATPEADSVAQLAETGKLAGKALADASVSDIEAATRAARKRAGATPQGAAAKARAKRDAALEKVVRAALVSAGLARPTVTVGTKKVRVEIDRATAERLLRA
ncbi:MAG: hypothetical protein EPO40_01835 [Myxococcaceae bacterium]|nr:MAG: hypothetical protein EPO40_01835 [Myxococcaceae bacterium]